MSTEAGNTIIMAKDNSGKTQEDGPAFLKVDAAQKPAGTLHIGSFTTTSLSESATVLTEQVWDSSLYHLGQL